MPDLARLDPRTLRLITLAELYWPKVDAMGPRYGTVQFSCKYHNGQIPAQTWHFEYAECLRGTLPQADGPSD